MLYWQIGQFISLKLATAEWGEGVVANLAEHIARTQPGLRGFTRANLFRMMHFFEAYKDNTIVSALLRQLPWTHHLLILSYSKREEEREFYIRLAIREGWSKRELERQIRSGVFERTLLAPPKVSPVVRQLYPEATQQFNDAYTLEFLDLPSHTAATARNCGLANLGRATRTLRRRLPSHTKGTPSGDWPIWVEGRMEQHFTGVISVRAPSAGTPRGVRSVGGVGSGGVACAQPPATCWEPFGFRKICRFTVRRVREQGGISTRRVRRCFVSIATFSFCSRQMPMLRREPEGFTAGSRWLSASDTTGHHTTNRTHPGRGASNASGRM